MDGSDRYCASSNQVNSIKSSSAVLPRRNHRVNKGMLVIPSNLIKLIRVDPTSLVGLTPYI